MSSANNNFPVIFSGDVLPEALNALFPVSVKQYDILSRRLNFAKVRRDHREGLWLLREDHLEDQDESGWFLMHWPTLTRLMIANGGMRRIFARHHGPGAVERFPSESNNPEHFETQWRTFRDAWNLLIPPGSSIWSDNQSFQNVLEVVPAAARLDNQLTVFRAGCLLSSRFKDLRQRLDYFQPFNGVGRIHPRVLNKLPDLLRLIVRVLHQARMDLSYTSNGWDDWGIAWCNQGLVVDGTRALLRARSHREIMSEFPGDIFERYLSEWLDPTKLEERCTIPGVPPLQKFVMSAHRYAERATVPLQTAITDWEDKKQTMEYSGRYMFFMPLRGGDNIQSVVKHLLEISEEMYSAPSIDISRQTKINKLLGEKQNRTGNSYKPRQRVSTKVMYSINVDMRHLGYYNPELSDDQFNVPQPMSMMTTKFRGQYYIAFPDVLIEKLPELAQPKYFWRNKAAEKTVPKDGNRAKRTRRRRRPMDIERPIDVPVNKYGEQTLDVQRRDLPSDDPACAYYEGVLFLNPKLLVPDDGEAITFLNSLLDVHPESNAHLRACAEAFNNFCKWLYIPQIGLDDGVFGGEFEYALNPDNPVSMSTMEERIHLLVDKAIHLQQKAVVAMPSPGRQGKRSYKSNNYDKFILWYVAKYELPELPVILNKSEYAEYLGARWIWWRRPLALRLNIDKPEYEREHYLKTPSLKTSEYKTMRKLVDHAKVRFGPSFTKID